jgi:hypothetical protein
MSYVKRIAGGRRRTAMALAAAAGLTLAAAATQPAQAALVFDVRATGVFSGVGVITDGGKTVVADPGAVINYSVFAQVTGAAGNAGLEGFQIGSGTIASGTGGQLVNLTHALVAPFNGNSSLPGDPTDLGTDGDTDIGGSLTPNNQTTGRITYRSAALTNGNAGGLGTSEFLLGSGTMTIGALSPTGTSVNFIIGTTTSLNKFPVWAEDGVGLNADTGSASVGAPVVINNVVPEPTSAALLGVVGLAGLATRRRGR